MGNGWMGRQWICRNNLGALVVGAAKESRPNVKTAAAEMADKTATAETTD